MGNMEKLFNEKLQVVKDMIIDYLNDEFEYDLDY